MFLSHDFLLCTFQDILFFLWLKDNHVKVAVAFTECGNSLEVVLRNRKDLLIKLIIPKMSFVGRLYISKYIL